MELNRNKSRFNLIAPFYNQLKKIFLQNNPEKVISKSIESLSYYSDILIVGGGADNTLQELIANKKASKIKHLDISSALSKLAKDRLGSFPVNKFEVDFKVYSFLEVDNYQKFDLIIFPFYLDLFSDDELIQNITKAKKVLKPNGQILVIDFCSNSSVWNKIKIFGLYLLFFPVTGNLRFSIPDFRKLFLANEFKLVNSEAYFGSFYKVWLFKEISNKN